MLGTGDCLLIDTNIDKGGYLQAHLFVIILDCEEHTRNTIILYVQTVGSPKAVWTTILIPGDHEFIKHESHTEYRQAQIFSVDDLDQMILVGTAHPMAHWLEVVGDVGSSGLRKFLMKREKCLTLKSNLSEKARKK